MQPTSIRRLAPAVLAACLALLLPAVAAAAVPIGMVEQFGSPGWTRIGFPSGWPAISTHSSRPPPTGTVLVSTPLDTNSLPLAGLHVCPLPTLPIGRIWPS